MNRRERKAEKARRAKLTEAQAWWERLSYADKDALIRAEEKRQRKAARRAPKCPEGTHHVSECIPPGSDCVCGRYQDEPHADDCPRFS